MFRVRVKYFGQTQDNIIAINQETDKSIELAAPKRYSALPVRSERNTPPYYKAEYLNREQTFQKSAVGNQPDGTLFIFIRMKDKASSSSAIGNLFSGLCLLDGQGNVACNFASDDVVNDPALGYARFYGSVAPGYYRLVFDMASGSREWMPLHILGADVRWRTEVSMIYKDHPLLSSMSIVTPSEDTPPALLEENIDDIDVAIQALSLGIKSTPVALELLDDFLTTEFDNPMLGIIGLHLLFLDDPCAPDVVASSLSKLHALVPRSPDVEALHYMACERGLMPARHDWAFYDIPLLRLGALAMQRALVTDEKVLRGVSPEQLKFFEQFFLQLRSDSLWSLTNLMDQDSGFRFGADSATSYQFDWSKLRLLAPANPHRLFPMDTSDILEVGPLKDALWKGIQVLDIKLPSILTPLKASVMNESIQAEGENSWLRSVVASEAAAMSLQWKGGDTQSAWNDLVKSIALKYQLMPVTVRAELYAYLSAELNRPVVGNLFDNLSIRTLNAGQSDSEDEG